MTRKDAVQLKGEVFGLQVLVMQSLCFIAAHTDNPVRHLATLRDAAVEGISENPNDDVLPRYLDVFQQAAAGVVMQCIDAAQDALTRDRLAEPQRDEASGPS